MNPNNTPTETPVVTAVEQPVGVPKQKNAVMGVVALISATVSLLVLLPFVLFPAIVAIEPTFAYAAYALLALFIPAIVLFFLLSTIALVFTIIGFVSSNKRGKIFASISAGILFVVNPIIVIVAILTASFS